MLTVSGCGGCTATDVTPSKPVDSSTLTGMWAGSLNGDGPNSFGYTTTLTELRADSTLTMTAATQPYGTLTGAWTVSAGKWISTGHDQTNTIITLTAPCRH